MRRYRFTLEYDAKDDMTAYDVATEVHDALVAILDYDTDTSEGSLVGVERVGATR